MAMDLVQFQHKRVPTFLMFRARKDPDAADESRYITLGCAFASGVLPVVWTERRRHDPSHSARRASAGEARHYREIRAMRNEYVFSNAKPVKDVPALTKLQTENQGKERITIRLDADVLDWFRARVAGGGNYQTLINDALRAHITDNEGALERTLRRIIREELHAD